MKQYSLEDILSVLEPAEVIESVRQAFIAHAEGRIKMPSPVQMVFEEDPKTDAPHSNDLKGDCHVKSAYSPSLPYFCIKVATGFYGNPLIGLPANNGLVMLLSASTGEPLALFQDEGHLTSARTAAAGALAASLSGSNGKAKRLGVIGTGHQAALQSQWIAGHINLSTITLYGRSKQSALLLADSLKDQDDDVANCEIVVADNICELCDSSDIIVTATPSTSPVLMVGDIHPRHHIVALGADSPGKIELDPNILAQASHIFTDDHQQALDHGEFGHGVRAGLIAQDSDIRLGDAFKNDFDLSNTDAALSVVDLTGLGAQDLAIASLIYEKLQ